MPKVGMEPVRRKALIEAAISAVGERGSLNVTMSEIAGRAGVSSALAHHYFGAKDELLVATMRQLLADLGADFIKALRRADTPRKRISAVVGVSFATGQFDRETVAAWLAFMVFTPFHAWSSVTRQDTTPPGQRPAASKGYNYLLVGSDSREGLTKAQKKEGGNYPMPDAAHARNAKARAAQQRKAGNLTKQQEERIDRKADKILDQD